MEEGGGTPGGEGLVEEGGRSWSMRDGGAGGGGEEELVEEEEHLYPLEVLSSPPQLLVPKLPHLPFGPGKEEGGGREGELEEEG